MTTFDAHGRIARRFQRMESCRIEVEEMLESLSDAQRAYSPKRGAWTIPQVVDHVIRVEEAVLDGARKPGVARTPLRRSLIGQLKAFVVMVLGLRVRVPRPVLHVNAADPAPSVESLLERWGEARDGWREFIERLPADQTGHMAIRHPILGPLSHSQAMWFLDRHLHRHIQQIERIRHSRNYPPSYATDTESHH